MPGDSGGFATVEEVLTGLIEPLVRQDGGELFLVCHTDSLLSLHLRGKFSGCPGNTLAVRRVIEPALHAVAPDLEITVSSGELVPEDATAVRSADAK